MKMIDTNRPTSSIFDSLEALIKRVDDLEEKVNLHIDPVYELVRSEKEASEALASVEPVIICSEKGWYMEGIRKKLEFGVPPLTLEECRHLYYQATGVEIKGRKRCDACNATGRVEFAKLTAGSVYGDCQVCNGDGYEHE